MSAAPIRTSCSMRAARMAARCASPRCRRRSRTRRSAWSAAIAAAGVAPADLDLVIHGTTATTNAILERKVAKVGLITTAGFRDTLELGRRTRPKPYGLFGTFEPLIPRERRLEVAERMDAQGDGRGAARRGRRRGGGAGAHRRRLREPRHPLPARLRQPRARAAGRRDRRKRSGRTTTSRSGIACCRSIANTSAARRPR